MNEHPTPERLNDYVDGVLLPDEGDAVEAHVAECATCAGEVRDLRSLLDGLESLPDSVEPMRDHWPALREEITRPSEESPRVVPMTPRRDRVALASPRVGWLGLAAAAVIAVVFGLTRPPAEDPRGGTVPPRAAAPEVPSSSMPYAALAALEAECVSASREVAALYVVRAGSLGMVAADLDDGLQLIDDAISETRAALEAHPGDAQLTFLLARRYEQKLEMLRRMLRLGNTA